MKKYFLTTLLGVFSLVSFASADSITTDDGIFTSDTNICVYDFNNSSYISPSQYDCLREDYNDECVYAYLDTDDVPYYMSNGLYCDTRTSDLTLVSSSLLPIRVTFRDSGIEIYEDPGQQNMKDVSGKVYLSYSPITFSANVNNGGDIDTPLVPVITGGNNIFSGIISGLNSTITEFIPYLVYLGLGIITVIIGFVAIRWLVNRTQAKIRGTFSSGRRRK